MNLATADKFDYGIVDSGDLVVHAAAISAPDICRDKPELAWSVNVEGTSLFIDKCLQRGANILFFSSDTVYRINGGSVINEDSPCAPQEPYGRMKHEVEKQFIGEPGFTTLRLSYVVSNFDKFTRYLRSCITENREAEIIRSFCRSAVAFHDIAAAVKAAIRDKNIPSPIINACGPQLLSRMEIAQSYKASNAPNMRLIEIEPPEGFFDSRPSTIPLTSKYFSVLLGREPLSIAEYYEHLTELL